MYTVTTVVIPVNARMHRGRHGSVTHALGRKRVLDTLLAATYSSSVFHCILTADQKGFALFGGISVLSPESAGAE